VSGEFNNNPQNKGQDLDPALSLAKDYPSFDCERLTSDSEASDPEIDVDIRIDSLLCRSYLFLELSTIAQLHRSTSAILIASTEQFSASF
jgi:hypothetical protein